MTKTDDRRSALLDQLADHVLSAGLAASSLRALAATAGTSDRMLLYYFKDKADMMAAIIGRVAERLQGILSSASGDGPRPLAEVKQSLSTLLLTDALWPYMRLWLEMASLSAQGDAFYRQVGEQIGRGFLHWGSTHLSSPTPQAHERDAADLLVTIEGLVLLKSLGLDEVGRKAIEPG